MNIPVTSNGLSLKQTPRARVLLVDDDPELLRICVRKLEGEFEIVTAENASQGLAAIAGHDAFSAVVADMHMPDMSGSEFLFRVERMSPDSARIMLTADSNQRTSVRAVNEGHIFRFLNKPVVMNALATVLRDGVAHHRLRLAEKELLSSTVNGSINLLVQILSLVSPLAFGRSTRVSRLAEAICRYLNVQDSWEVTVAALLSHLGCITIPDWVVQKQQREDALSGDEARIWVAQPQIAADLVARIPRLSRVAQIIANQSLPWKDPGSAQATTQREIRWRAAILKAAIDFDLLVQQGRGAATALHVLEDRNSQYEPDILAALRDVVSAEIELSTTEVFLHQLQAGMILEEPICDHRGTILITKGQELAQWHIDRLRRHDAMTCNIAQPMRVLFNDCDREPVASIVSIPGLQIAPALTTDELPPNAAANLQCCG